MEGRIVGKPTLLAIYDGRVNAEQVLGGLRELQYPAEDIAVYYRPKGTDQVIDAVTGQVAAGQSITEQEMDPKNAGNVQTLVLMHPEPQQVEGVRRVLMGQGQPEIMYEAGTLAQGHASVSELPDGKV